MSLPPKTRGSPTNVLFKLIFYSAFLFHCDPFYTWGYPPPETWGPPSVFILLIFIQLFYSAVTFFALTLEGAHHLRPQGLHQFLFRDFYSAVTFFALAVESPYHLRPQGPHQFLFCLYLFHFWFCWFLFCCDLFCDTQTWGFPFFILPWPFCMWGVPTTFCLTHFCSATFCSTFLFCHDIFCTYTPTLDGGYLPWMGAPTPAGGTYLGWGYLSWPGGTYLKWGVPTSAKVGTPPARKRYIPLPPLT